MREDLEQSSLAVSGVMWPDPDRAAIAAADQWFPGAQGKHGLRECGGLWFSLTVFIKCVVVESPNRTESDSACYGAQFLDGFCIHSQSACHQTRHLIVRVMLRRRGR